MSHSLFISDLHLSIHTPKTTQRFHYFIRHIAPKAEALYILGDLFEYWAGDDDLDAPFHLEITTALRNLSLHGTTISIMHGNRDFLMSKHLAAACNAKLLADPIMLDLYGTPTLLSHGDTLCTDDTDYLAFRQQVRNASWQKKFLELPLAHRKAQIEQVRAKSESEKQHKSVSIMDVNLQAVNETLIEYNFPRFIHGHTHRPAHHLHHIEGHTCDRWVLGDWDKHANALHCEADKTSWVIFPDESFPGN
jgi:UDP-2,3-diacylglucosamine hydrolase